MASHEALRAELLESAERCLKRLDRLRSFLLLAGTLAQEDEPKWRFLTLESRASAIVCAVAELEALLRTSLASVHRELNQSTLNVGVLRPSLRPLVAHAEFEGLREMSPRGSRIWDQRQYVTDLASCADAPRFPIETKAPQPPLDGRTLTPDHFGRIWRLYGLPGEPFPGVAMQQSLTKLGGLRNDLAHGLLPFDEIFKTAGLRIDDVDGYLSDMADLALHYAAAWDEYLQYERYLAP